MPVPIPPPSTPWVVFDEYGTFNIQPAAEQQAAAQRWMADLPRIAPIPRRDIRRPVVQDAAARNFENYYYNPIGSPAPPPVSQRFVIQDEEERQFYERAYSGARFPVGSTHRHNNYVVTPDEFLDGDAERLSRIRAQAGMMTPGGVSLADVVASWEMSPAPAPPRLRLPRDAVEPLPLPG